MLLEDFQQFAFPVVVVLFFTVARYLKLGISNWLAVIPLLFWIVSLCNILGVVASSGFGPSMAMARLVDDPELELRGKFFRDYQKLARQKSLPALGLLEKQIPDSKRALQSLEAKGLDVLVSGSFSWLTVSLSKDRLEKISGISPLVKQDLEYENYLSPDDVARLMVIKGIDQNNEWLVLKGPQSVLLPTRDSLLAGTFIGWLGTALGSKIENESSDFSFERSFALSRITESFGLWATNVPRAFAGFLLGTSHLINSVENKVLPEIKICSRSIFAAAASRVSASENPELYAAIFNNAAVAKILSTTTPHVMRQARAELWKAANTRDSRGELAPGARVAYVNLLKLERLGLVIR